MELTTQQRKIVEYPDNLLVIANAGTGKTFTLVKKMEYELRGRKDFRKIGAITFTVKAAKEIRDRIYFDMSDSFVGTTNGFVLQEIIIPFFEDYYKRTVVEHIHPKYDLLIDSFQEGIEKIVHFGSVGKYSPEYTKKNPQNGNFMFSLALIILQNSDAARKYLQARYFKMFIDEYQDCDTNMHEFFMYIANELNIKLFLVGDNKQSIYQWRGASPQIFEDVQTNKNFLTELLVENFRSTQGIQNFSNLLFQETVSFYKETNKKDDIVFLECTQQNWVQRVQNYLDKEDVALLRWRRNSIQQSVDELNGQGIDFTYIPPAPLDEISSEDMWFYRGVAEYALSDTYSVHDFINEIPNGIESGIKMSILKTNLKKIRESKKEVQTVKDHIEKVMEITGVVNNEANLELLLKTITNDDYENTFNQENFDRLGMTFFAAKGLQFNQVIIFASDYNLNIESEAFNHYVSVTRAKNKLIIIVFRNVCDHNYMTPLEDKLHSNNLNWNDIAVYDGME